MVDVQNHPAGVALSIDRVGVTNLRLPVVVSDRIQGSQHTVASVTMGVDLPAAFKGTHMSRFLEALSSWSEELGYHTVKGLLQEMCGRLKAEKAYVRFEYPYFIRRQAPVSRMSGLMAYDCRLSGELSGDGLSLVQQVTVPVMTVCPCSKAISCEGAHSQRADVALSVRMKAFCWLEDYIAMAERAGSSPVYPLLKREDEKYVTEHAFARPVFVEDVVREVARALSEHPSVAGYRVDVESFESIHGHNAFARMERNFPA
jgi:GTP cyclohydrolase I